MGVEASVVNVLMKIGSTTWRTPLLLTGLAGLAMLPPPLAAASACEPTQTQTQTQTQKSSNWAGYVARSSTQSGGSFSSVSGSWTQPSASCSVGSTTYSAVWVGLGGYREHASALEQIGTDADCERSGKASFSSWFELVPAGPVDLHLKIDAGDRLSASATVIGHDATLRLRNLSTGAHVSVTRRLSHMDISSAEWIVEAPSLCTGESRCHTLPLSDFGQVQFNTATATSGGRTASLSQGPWATTKLMLR